MIEHIYLTGYRGTGKTSVGQELAQQLGRPLIDTDDAVVRQAAGPTIAQIFEQSGEAAFRDMETDCLSKVAEANESAVVSLGGGAVLREQNRRLIAQSGCCVWLRADPETLAERIYGDPSSKENRPALTDLDPLQEIRDILARREPIYRDAADHIVDTDGKSVQEISAEIARLLGIST